MRKKYKVGVLLCLVIMFVVAICSQFNKKDNLQKGNTSTTDIKFVITNSKQEIYDISKGRYSNLNIISLENNITGIKELQQIKLIPDETYKENKHCKNLEIVKNTINNFFKNTFDMSSVTVSVYDMGKEKDGEKNYKDISYSSFEKQINDNTLKADKYFMLFGDAREHNGKGFLQIDFSLSNIWFSKGKIPATLPMFSYDTKKVYNLTISKKNMDDKVSLKNGDISIKDSVKFIEKYLNYDLPYEKNEDFTYRVAEVRVLNVDGQNALGFCVRKYYNNIPFDYIDAATEGEYISDFYDDRGELCMIEKDDVDNICGLCGDTYKVEKVGQSLTSIVSLDKAFEIVSEEIGENSVYNVYGAELMYQFKEKKSDSGKTYYEGRINWKITTRNQNDKKDTLFYVDVCNGKITNRFKKIYGE